MDLSLTAIEEVVHPTAAFYRSSGEAERPPETLAYAAHRSSWETSMLNPKNRIDSLALPDAPLWRVDGCAGLGTQYYTLPLFISNLPPMRMDVFVAENQQALIQEQLDLNIAFHTKDSARLSRLSITRHLIRTLQHWTETNFESLQTFEHFYRNVPFGSRIVFENMSLDIRQIHVRIGANHDLERQLLALPTLTTLWGTDFELPPLIDFFDVHVVGVLHDSVCLVRIYGQLYIFKALTSGAKYLYHELKILCKLEPHPNVIARPIHLVKKSTAFGKKKAIVGFTTFYHSNGSLRDYLPQLRIHNQLRRSDQLKWSTQLATALEHLRTRTAIYYPDLRLDNIVLSEQSDIVMVDFEQRGVWCEFAAPEVNAIEYIRLIATDEKLPWEIRDKYVQRMKSLVPDFDLLEEHRYTNPGDGYNATWIALSAAEQEAAEVYMLGRVLWCIFEGVSGPQKTAVWQSYRWESDLEFPEYDRTPPEMRDLIDRCTRGRRRTLNGNIIRQHSQLILRSKPAGEQTEEEVKEAARQYWLTEVEEAERFLEMRDSLRQQGQWRDNYYDRPSLKEVVDILQMYKEEEHEEEP